MAEIGDIIEIPYEEGICAHCGWVVTREEGDPWSGMLGGDCRIDCTCDGAGHEDGEHFVAEAMTKTRRARIAEGVMTSVRLMNGDMVISRQEFPADGNWTEHWGEEQQVTGYTVEHRKYRYHAAAED